jgi:Flp pilus assembly pilin Flp
MTTLARRLARDVEGQDLIEYSLLIGIITVACMLALVAIGGKVQAYLQHLNTAMPAPAG